MTKQSNGAGTVAASLAAIGSVLAASSCCLPILPFVLAASLAGGATFLAVARPYLLGASILFIAFGFYQGWRAKKCDRRPSLVSSILLWTSTIVVIMAIVFPQVMANAFAGVGHQAPSGQPALESLTAANVSDVKSEFNGAKDRVRVLLLLSPT
jgi:cytochrome bd-type quinol oxidase subunit 2